MPVMCNVMEQKALPTRKRSKLSSRAANMITRAVYENCSCPTIYDPCIQTILGSML